MSLQRAVLAVDTLYRTTALYRKTRLHQRLRSGPWRGRVPSIQRGIDWIGGGVDRLIVAQGLSPEKLIAQSDPLTPMQRSAATLLQVTLACACVVLIWLNWPDSAAAPIVDTERISTASAAMNDVDPTASSSAVETLSSAETVAESAAESGNSDVERIVEDLQTSSVVLIGEQADVKPQVETVLAQVSANTNGDERADLPNETSPSNTLVPLLDQTLIDQTLIDQTLIDQTLIDQTLIDQTSTTEGVAESIAVDPENAVSETEVPQDEASAAILSRLEVAIAKAMEDAASKPENAPVDNLVVVEPQVQPKSQEPQPQAVAPSSTYPFATVLGPEWESFTPLSAEEIDHYWLGAAFPAGYNQFYSPSYQFGSTAGGRYRPHHGVDISNPLGTPVIAMAGGEVIHAGPDNPTLLGPYNNFYGNSVVVRLDRMLSTPEGEKEVFLLYGHLNEVFAERGQRLNPGDSVGTVGMTGIAIGPHLHVEIRVGQNSYMTAVNPVLWMQPPGGTGSVAIRLVNAQGQSWAGARVSLLRYEGQSARWVRTVETYRSEERLRGNPLWGENGAASNLSAGSYYIAAEVNGEKVGQNIVVEDGKTTFVELRTQQ